MKKKVKILFLLTIACAIGYVSQLNPQVDSSFHSNLIKLQKSIAFSENSGGDEDCSARRNCITNYVSGTLCNGENRCCISESQNNTGNWAL